MQLSLFPEGSLQNLAKDLDDLERCFNALIRIHYGRVSCSSVPLSVEDRVHSHFLQREIMELLAKL